MSLEYDSQRAAGTVAMLSLSSVSLSFASTPKVDHGAHVGTNDPNDPGFCVCGNFPLYSSMNGAGADGHCMSFFGMKQYMPMGGSMSGGACPPDMQDRTPADADCATAMSKDVCGGDSHDMDMDMDKPTSSSNCAMVADGFVPYFSYTGALAVSGSVNVFDQGSEHGTVIDFELYDLDPDCESGPDTVLSANSCGIHIHTGTSCEADAGDHYFVGDSDPWGAGYYTYAWFTSNTGAFQLMSGLTAADMPGKTLIVHDHAGKRIACAIIQPPAESC